MHLARLSQALRARKVAWAWDDLSKPDRDSVLPESLCDQVGITSADFLAAVMSTGFELAVDVGALFGAMVKMPDALSVALRQASSMGMNLAEAHTVLQQIGSEVRRR